MAKCYDCRHVHTDQTTCAHCDCNHYVVIIHCETCGEYRKGSPHVCEEVSNEEEVKS